MDLSNCGASPSILPRTPNIGHGEATRVGKIMKALGWKRKQLRVDGKQQWGYAAPVTIATTPDEDKEPPFGPQF
jgi:hypothetical protein